MTQQSQRPRPQDRAKRQQRAQQILDAAAALILRWGYNKTTIDDVARQAGVAKGTIYLHWKTREELFAALLRRERLAMTEDVRQRMSGDPASATLHIMLRHVALALLQRPLMKAVLFSDIEVLGKLAQRERSTASYAERLLGFESYLGFLREHGLVRTDLTVPAQIYMLSAIFMGFFLVAPLVPEQYTISDDEMADLLAETIRCSLGPPQPLPADQLERVSQTFTQYLNRSIAIAEEQLQHEVDP